MELSIVIPVRNAEETLGALCDRLSAVRETLGMSAEIVLVDDASTDATAEMLRAVSAAAPAVRIRSLDRNRGQALALVAGLSHARGRRIVVMDDDLHHPPESIPALLEAQARAGGNALAIAVPLRRRRGAWRALAGLGANAVSNLLLPRPIPLRMTSFCCFSRSLADDLSGRVGPGGAWLTDLVQGADRTVAVPLELGPSARARSRYTFGSLAKLFVSRARYFSPARIAAGAAAAGAIGAWWLL